MSEELEAILAPLANIGDLRETILETLSEPERGFIFNESRRKPWPILPLLSYEAICGNYEKAIPVALAIQFLMVAGDIFDDVEDADNNDSVASRYGPAIATNIATLLIILAEKSLVRVKLRGVEDSLTLTLINDVNSSFSSACAGQHLDLLLGSSIYLDENNYLRLIELKSASQVRCACRVGAMLATQNQYLIDLFAQFGLNLGMASQICNDISGISSGHDIIKQKVTLPVIFGLANLDSGSAKLLKESYDKSVNIQNVDPTLIKELLFRSGAVHYTTLKMECYIQTAKDILDRAAKFGVITEELERFIV